jgi:hypothetical protein
MKTKKTITVLLIFLLILHSKSGWGAGQFKGDTIRIKFEKFMIEVISSDLTKNSLKQAKIAENATKISDLIETVRIIEPSVDELIYILISGVDGNKNLNYQNVTFENRKKNLKKMVFSNGKILEKNLGNYLVEFHESLFTINYYLTELQDLITISSDLFNLQIESAEKLIPDGRKKINGWLTFNDEGNFDTHFLDETSPATLDMLNLSVGVGVGIIKNQWVNDISFKIGLGFMNKGLERNVYFAEFKMYYDFSNASNDNIFSINSFVSVGWEHNYSKTFEKEKWFGLSAGYLVDRKTDFFEKNTFKIAVHKRINQTISISPELYFNGFFKNINPGVQIGISF